MPDPVPLQTFLAGAAIDPAVAALRPDYRVLLLAVDGLTPEASAPADDATGPRLRRAEEAARDALRTTSVDVLPHVAAWREAYRAFGARPQRTRNSLEALLRRAADGLPRVNRLTDLYNAVSVTHQVPLGGEDLDTYVSAPRVVRATGHEPFDTTAEGERVVEHPEPGEVVWVDDAGVTCRRWNWRQSRRTRLTDQTSRAFFVLDALDPFTDDALEAAADELDAELRRLGPDVHAARRLLRARE